MNKKNFVYRTLALTLAVISMMFVFTSCEYKPEPPDENAFSLVMDFAQTTVKVGTKVTYRAILENAEHESYKLKHADKLIQIYVVKPDKYLDPEAHMALSDSTVSETGISPHGQAEEFCEFTAEEKGSYILKAYTAFTIEDKETTKSYFYECKEITITVV